MFQNNCRIERKGGLAFYEQDILFDDYIYTEDTSITICADYLSPGLGIVLAAADGEVIQDKTEAYLFKIGLKSIEMYRVKNGSQKRLAYSIYDIEPIAENITLTLTKSGKRIGVYINNEETALFNMYNDIEKYNIGIYSNANNVIKSFSVESLVPHSWTINMHNTNGGYIRFVKDTIEIVGCQNEAEIEQNNIVLSEGYYYLDYETENAGNAENDMQCYVFYSNDNRTSDKEKNILKGNVFLVENGVQQINIKFKGKNGLIKNISLSDKKDSAYVSTDGIKNKNAASKLIINTTQKYGSMDLKTVKINAAIHATDEESIFFKDGIETIYLRTGKIEGFISQELSTMKYISTIKNKNYDISIDLTQKTIRIESFSIPLKSIQDEITLFENANITIDKLVLVFANNDKEIEIDTIMENTSVRYIPDSTSSPIIVINEDGEPLDLSSSYRYVINNGKKRYYFTNTAREIFEPEKSIKVAKQISSAEDSVKVYGIFNDSIFDESRLYEIPERYKDTIDACASRYVTINEADLYYVDKKTGNIYIEDVSKFKKLIVDYVKAESYCINHLFEDGVYEVQISTMNNTKVIYDDNSIDNNGENVSDYYTTNIVADSSGYIVIRR